MVFSEPPAIDYDEVYRKDDQIPWDIGEPQPALAELVRSGWCTGRVLDIGCGTAQAGLALAARGHRVTGIDLSPHAIAMAELEAADRGLDIELATADVTRLQGYDGLFDTVLDSGLLHCLGVDDQRRYLDVLRRMCRVGGRVAVLCFADVPGTRAPDGGRLTEAWLPELFDEGWEIDALRAADILGVFRDGHEPPEEWPRDEHGRVRMNGWLLRARPVDR